MRGSYLSPSRSPNPPTAQGCCETRAGEPGPSQQGAPGTTARGGCGAPALARPPWTVPETGVGQRAGGWSPAPPGVTCRWQVPFLRRCGSISRTAPSARFRPYGRSSSGGSLFSGPPARRPALRLALPLSARGGRGGRLVPGWELPCRGSRGFCPRARPHWVSKCWLTFWFSSHPRLWHLPPPRKATHVVGRVTSAF